MRLTQEAIGVIRDRVDILAVIGEYVPLKKSGQNWTGLCPFHADKNTPSFSVNPEKKVFYCFGCGKGGDVFRFLQDKESKSFPEAVELLGRRLGLDVNNRDDRSGIEISAIRNRLRKVAHWSEHKATTEEELDYSMVYWEAVAAPLLTGASKYLIERGVTIETIKEWKIGRTRSVVSGWSFGMPWSYAPTFIGDSRRAVFTIRDRRGKLVGLSGRRIADHGPKYFHWPGFKRNRHLYGADKVDPAKDHLIVVEGFIDVLVLWQLGFNVVGIMGSKISELHIKLLISLLPRGGRMYPMFDGDEAGRLATARLIEDMRHRVPLYSIMLGDHVDPKMMAADDIRKSMELAKLS